MPPKNVTKNVTNNATKTNKNTRKYRTPSSRATDASLRLLENVVLAFVQAVPPPRSSPASTTTTAVVLLEDDNIDIDGKNAAVVGETATLAEGARTDGGGGDGEGSGVGGENGMGKKEGGPQNGVICVAGDGGGWDGERAWCAQVGVLCCAVQFCVVVVWYGLEEREGCWSHLSGAEQPFSLPVVSCVFFSSLV